MLNFCSFFIEKVSLFTKTFFLMILLKMRNTLKVLYLNLTLTVQNEVLHKKL